MKIKDHRSKAPKLSEELIGAFFNSANEAFILLDRDLRIVKVNPNLERRVGKTNSELHGMRFADIFPDVERSGRIKEYLRVLETGEPVEMLNETTHPSGLGERVANLYAFKVGDGLGLVVNDITELIQYETRLEALHEHATKIAAAETIEEISEISLEIMASTFNFEFISFLEVRNSSLVGIGSRGAPLANIKLPLEGKGITVRAARSKRTVLVNDTREDKDYMRGSTDSLSELAVPVVVDGETAAVLNAESNRLNAYTEQDRRLLEILASHVASAINRIVSQKRLIDSERLTQSLMNEITDGIYITDLRNNVLEVNGAIPRSLGYTKAELLKGSLLTRKLTRSGVDFREIKAELQKSGRSLFDAEIVTKDGEVVPIEVSSRLINYRGKPAIIGVARDLRERRRNEARLRESEELYRTILESAPDPVSISVDGKIVYANPGRLRLTGASRFEEFEGKDIFSLVHPDDVAKLRDWDVAAPRDRITRRSYEFRIRRNDGTYAQIEATSTPIRFKGQHAALHVLHDITQRREYEDHLAKLHMYTRNLAAATNIDEASRVVGEAVQGMLDTSFGSVGIVSGNVLRFLHVYGIDWDEGGKIPIDGPGITTRAVRTGETQLVRDVSRDSDYFLTGSKLHTSRSEVAVPIKVEGAVAAIINVESELLDAYSESDVSLLETLGNHFASAIQRIRSAESLAKSEERYRNLFEGVNDTIFIHDLEGRFLNANTIAEQTLGYTVEELRGMKLSDIDSKTDQALIRDRMEELKIKGHNIFEVTHISKSGERIETEVNARIIEYEGKPAVLSACRDITERRRYIDQLHKLHWYAIRLGQASSLPAVYDITFKEMKETLRHRRCSLRLLDNGVLTDLHRSGYGQIVGWSHFLDGKGITVRAARTGETVYVPDVDLDPDYIEAAPENEIRSEIAVPVKVHEKVVAVLNVERSEVGAFTEIERGLLEILANHTASALIRLEQVNGLQEHEKRLMALNECASDLASAETMDGVWDIAVDLIERDLKHDFAGIGVVSGEFLEYMRFLGATPSQVFRLRLDGPGITTRAIRTGETQMVNDITEDKDFVTFNVSDGPLPSLSELAVPVKLGDKPYAIINIESTELNAFDEADRSLLEILAKHVEEAANRIKYVEEIKLGEAQMATLHEFTNRLAEAESLKEASAVAADALSILLNTKSGSLSFVEGDALHHIYVYGTELEREFVQPLDGRGITVRAAVTGKPQLVADVRLDHDYQKPDGVVNINLSELAVPMKVEGRVVAVINAESPLVGAFTIRDQRLLELFAMHLGSTFARIRENESKERYRSRLEALSRLVARLDTAQSPLEIATIAEEMIQSLSQSNHARLALVEGNELVVVSPLETPGAVTHLQLSGKGITVKAVNERQTIYVKDTGSDPDFVKGGIEALSEFAIPLAAGGRVIGVLNMESTLRDAFSPDDMKLAETLALHLTSTLERLRLDRERFETQIELRKREFEAEQAKELERMKTRFISTATHEIRTPLTSIKGYTELIQGELGAGRMETAKRYFGVIGRNVDRLVNLTDDLLDTQRIEEGRMALTLTTFDVGAFLTDLATDITPLLSKRKQTLSISMNGGGEIRADRSRLMQVLVNLVSNSSKFSPAGSVIYITMKQREGEAVFNVRDLGVGLAPEDMPKLFKPFPGIHVEGNPEGTGLGLSICRGIVEMHGGRIWAESKGRGKGATFSFTIPEAEK